MRLSKFLIIIAVITSFALLYVWQQTEIFRFAYKGEKNLSAFEDLLDRNTILRYNIKRNASLIRIDKRVSEYADFQLPETYWLVRLGQSKEILKVDASVPKKENIISRLFGIKRQAEAKTISPSVPLPSTSSAYFE